MEDHLHGCASGWLHLTGEASCVGAEIPCVGPLPDLQAVARDWEEYIRVQADPSVIVLGAARAREGESRHQRQGSIGE